MERIKEVQQTIEKLYQEFYEKMGKTPDEIDLNDPVQVEKAFEKVFNADYKATRLKTSFPRTLALNLRKAFADLLLLMEGKDIKKVKEEAEAAAAEAEAEAGK